MFIQILKRITFILLAQLLPFMSMGQSEWESYLVNEVYNKWDSIKCKEFYSITDSKNVFSHPQQIVEITGLEKLGNVSYPAVPSNFRLEGKVYFKFVFSKENEVECLKVYSALPEAYIKKALNAFSQLSFKAAQNSGKNVDSLVWIPIKFSDKESSQKKKENK